MIEMNWFFADRRNFVAFSQYLKNRPNKVYSSWLIQILMTQYWATTQRELVYKQFLPFIIRAVLSIVYFVYMLNDDSETEDPSTDQV